jgi:Xaa-Pro dipeptidase
MSLYAENRAKVITSLLSKLSNSSRGIVLLEGGKQETRHDTDHEPVFRQESYFHYLFGTNLPDCYGALSFLGDERKSVLFVPTWGEEVATVCGESPDFEELANELGMDLVLGVDSLSGWVDDELDRLKSEKGTANGSTNGVNGHSSGDPRLFVLKGLNTDSGNYAKPAYYKGIESIGEVIDEDTLFNCIAECRVHKVSSNDLVTQLKGE